MARFAQPDMSGPNALGACSRRSLLGAASLVALTGIVRSPIARATPTRRASAPRPWQPWLPLEHDVAALPPSAITDAEVTELLDLQERRTPATDALVRRWNGEPPVLTWTDITLQLIREQRPSPPRAARLLALLHTAMHDALRVVADAQALYARPQPADRDARLMPMRIEPPAPWSYPSPHAALAGAATTILAGALAPDAGILLDSMADDAMLSRLWMGANVRSDLDAGMAIGRAIGRVALARIAADDSAPSWYGASRPTGTGFWEPTPPAFIDQPLDPAAGSWLTWIIPAGNALRPSPPPAYGSRVWQAEMASVQRAVAARNPEQAAAVESWAGGPGSVTPAGLWTEIARGLIVRDRLDLPSAARVLALTSTAMADAFVCCWDAKYTYWTARPITGDPMLDVQIPTPPFPSYPSGHSTVSAAAATLLGALFPADQETLNQRALEAKNSRLWAGIHFPIDNDIGELGGRQIGRLTIFDWV